MIPVPLNMLTLKLESRYCPTTATASVQTLEVTFVTTRVTSTAGSAAKFQSAASTLITGCENVQVNTTGFAVTAAPLAP